MDTKPTDSQDSYVDQGDQGDQGDQDVQLKRITSITKVGAKLQRMIKEAREHPLGLYRLCFTDDRGEAIVLKWFHKEWTDLVLNHSHIMIEAPRGCTKTSFMVAVVLWFLGHNPELRMKIICGNDSNAAKRLKEIRSHINENPIYQLIFPGIEEDPQQTNNSQILNLKRQRHSKDSTLEAKGILSDGTGDRCLTPDTKLMSSRGIITANDVQIGTRLITHTGRSQKVEAVRRQVVDEPTVTVQLAYSQWPITTTEDHRYLTYQIDDNNIPKIDWVRADKLTTGMHILHPKGVSNSTHKIFGNNDKQKAFSKLVSDEFVWRFLGYYCGDGWLSSEISGYTRSGNPKYRKARQITLAFNALTKEDATYVKDIQENAKRLGWNYTITPRNNTIQVCINGQTVLAEICARFGCPAPKKTIPTFIMRTGVHKKRQFLTGYWRADGSVTNNLYSIATASEQLAAQTWQLMLDVDILASINKNDGPARKIGSIVHGRTLKANGPLYLINARGSKAATLFEPNKTLEETNRQPNKYQPNHGWISHSHAYIPIRKLQHNHKTEQEVIGIKVQEDNSHCHPIGTTHNSDILLLDDICTRKNSVDEPATRPKVLGKLRSDWLNTLNPRDGRVWSIFTPWHNSDANAILKKETKGRWAYKRYAHGKRNDPYHSIFPEIFTNEWLKRKRQEIGTVEYAQAYLCRAISEDIQIVHHSWLRPYNKLDVTSEFLKRAACVLSIDPTGGKRSTRSKNSDPDYIGISVVLVDTIPNGNPLRPKSPNRIYVVEAYQVRLSTADAALHTIQLAHKWQADMVVIETQGAQSIHEWVYELDSSIPVQEWPATLSKKARLESITPWLQDPRQRILFHPRTIEVDPKPFNIIVQNPRTPDEPPTRSEALRPLRKQLIDFPTTHDDVMDATVQALRYIRQCVLPLDNETEESRDEDRAQDLGLEVRTIMY